MAKINLKEYFRQYQVYVIFAAFGLVFSVMAIVYLGGGSDKDPKVKVSEVSTGPLTAIIEAPGMIGSEKDKAIDASTSGEWQMAPDLNLAPGQRVHSGQYLGQVNDPALIEAYQKVKVEYEFALLDYKNKVDTLELNKKLYAQKAISKKDLDASKIDADKYRRQTLVDSDKKLKEAEAKMADTKVFAPFDGTLVELLVRPGERASSSKKVVRIADLSQLTAKLDVAEYDIAKVKVNQIVQLTDGFLGTRTVKAKVTEIESVAIEKNSVRRITVHCAIPLTSVPKDLLMVMDGSIRGEILIQSVDQATQILKTAVIVEGSDHYIFGIKDSKAVKHKITLGLEGKDTVQVLSGLAPAEKFISAGHLNLEDGQRVQVVDKLEGEEVYELF